MDGQKRKSTSCATATSNKQRKIDETKVNEGNYKPSLKTVFSKIKINGDDRWTYKIKEDIPRKMDDQLTTDANGVTNSTTICSKIPEFTDEDIDELINYGDLDLFTEDGENDALDDAVNNFAFSSTPDFPYSSATEAENQTSNVENRIDLSIRETSFQQISSTMPPYTQPLPSFSSPMPSYASPMSAHSSPMPASFTPMMPAFSSPISLNSVPNSSLSSRFDSYIKKMRQRLDKEITLTYSATRAANRMKTSTDDRKCSSTTDDAVTRIKTITKLDRPIYTNKNRDNRKTLQTPSQLLEEILRLQGIRPSYDVKPLSSVPRAMFHCHVSFKKYNAYGSGKSVNDAKNLAASSLLEMLISNRYFGNIIGNLQELCMFRGWQLPRYTEEKVVCKRSNMNIFVFSCSLNQHKEFGQGKSKKMAKLFSAYKVWMKLATKKGLHNK